MGDKVVVVRDEDRELVLELVGSGMALEEVAPLIRYQRSGRAFSVAGLKRHFAAEIEAAPAFAKARVVRALYKLATGENKGSPAAVKYWLEVMDRSGVAGGEDDGFGGGLALTDDERVERLRVLYERLRKRVQKSEV